MIGSEMNMKHTLLLYASLLCTTPLWATQDGLRTYEEASADRDKFLDNSFEASDLPGDMLLVTASQPVNPSNVSFYSAPYGIGVYYEEREEFAFSVWALNKLFTGLDVLQKNFVLLEFPSGERKQFHLQHNVGS